MTDLAQSAGPIDGARTRLTLPVRIALLILCAAALLFSIGAAIGVGVALAEKGTVQPTGIAVLGAAVIGALLLAWASWRLSAHWRRPGRSDYERRYSKMMLLMFSAALPVGLLIGMAGDGQPGDSLLSNGPLDPTLATLAAIGLVVTLGATLLLYHRSIDDHEQQAYLWANSLAFYFLALALPAVWLLARGGVIGPIGIGTAMLMLLAAFVINFTVWAWLKFR